MLYYDILISFGYYSCLGIFGQPFTVRVNRTFRLNGIFFFFYDVFFDRKKKNGYYRTVVLFTNYTLRLFCIHKIIICL